MLSKRVLLLAAASLVAAQVTTDCNPLKKSCPADPALGTSHSFNLNQSVSGDLFENYGGGVDFDAEQGATFTIKKQGDSPTLRTKFYFFFGQTEIILKAAAGQGIVSSMMWLSDDLDEVDWEFLGTNTTHASSNYFGKGVQDWHNGKMHPMPSPPQDTYHNYTTHWTKDKLDWYIDGDLVRSLTPDQANQTKSYPQTPMKMSFGIWAGGDPTLPEGTRQWAGGDTDYGKGPYNMYVKSVKVSDFSSGKEYKYGDNSGSWQSIDIVDAGKKSSAVEAINKPPPKPEESTSEKWNNLSSGAKIGIYCGVGTFVALAIVGAAIYCIKQRRRGAHEAKMAAQRAEDERLEMEKFEKEGRNPDALRNEGVDYDARSMAGRTIDGNDSVADLHQMPPVAPGGGHHGWDASDAAMAAAIGGAGGAAGAAGAAMYSHARSQSPSVTSPASSTFHAVQSPRSPPLGGLGTPSGNAGYQPVDQGPVRSNTPVSSVAPSYHDDPRAAYGSGYGSPMNGPQSPPPQGPFRTASPGMPPPQATTRVQSGMMMRQQSPGLPPQGALPPTPSYPSRAGGSPAPQQGGFSRQMMNSSPGPRMQSPASRMGSPGPNRMQSPGPGNGYGSQGGGYGGSPHAY